jgi:hypothetical protein
MATPVEYQGVTTCSTLVEISIRGFREGQVIKEGEAANHENAHPLYVLDVITDDNDGRNNNSEVEGLPLVIPRPWPSSLTVMA